MLCDCFSAVLQNFCCHLCKASWGLNMSVGISADLWRHPLSSTQTALPTNRKPFIFRWKVIWFAWCGSQKNPLVKSKPFFRETTISNLLLLGVGKIGTTGHLYFRKQKNSSEARFADATTIDERQAGQAAVLVLWRLRQSDFIFWNFFLDFLTKVKKWATEKSGTSSPCQRKKIYQKFCLLIEKILKKLFLFIKFSEWEKFYYFPTRICLSIQVSLVYKQCKTARLILRNFL